MRSAAKDILIANLASVKHLRPPMRTASQEVIRLDGPVVLPEGTAVRVEIAAGAPRGESENGGTSLYERLKPVIGAAKDLPEDASVNVDHYLYGLPQTAMSAVFADTSFQTAYLLIAAITGYVVSVAENLLSPFAPRK